MEINNDYPLGDKNFHNKITPKNQILLMDTNSYGVQHYFEWLNKPHTGSYKYTAPYTIMKDGVIYEHYDSNYWSDIFNVDSIDRNIIPVMLENEGKLTFNGKNKRFYNWSGDIYKKEKDSVFIKKWRGGFFWGPYTTEQLDSLAYLIFKLCDKHNIVFKFRGEDYEDVDVEKYNGVVTKHDYNILSTHLNPGFDMGYLKNKVKEYEKTIN
jgi:hypothetical protein